MPSPLQLSGYSLHELLLLSPSPTSRRNRSRQRGAARTAVDSSLEMAATPPRRRRRGTGEERPAPAVASPRNARRSRRRLEKEIEPEEDAARKARRRKSTRAALRMLGRSSRLGIFFSYAFLCNCSCLASRKQARGAEGQSVVRRLQSELMALMMGGDPGVPAFPEGDNIFQWVGTIDGSDGTAYEGTSYRLALPFPSDYPYKPPKDKWSSAYDVRTILLSIQSLLGEPNNDSPLNTQAAALWANQEGKLQILPLVKNPSASGCNRSTRFLVLNLFAPLCLLCVPEFRKMVEKLYKPA